MKKICVNCKHTKLSINQNPCALCKIPTRVNKWEKIPVCETCGHKIKDGEEV